VVALLCLIWGSTWLAIKEGLRDLPPFTSAGARFLLAAVVFSAITPLLRRREGGAAPPFWLLAVMGLLNFTVSYGIVYWGETVIPSGLAAVLWSVFPVFVAVLSHSLLPEERLLWRHWLGFVTALAGIVLLFLTDLRGIGAGAVGAGALFLASPLVAAVGNVIIKRHGARYSSLLLNRGGLIIGALVLCLTAWIVERDAPVRWTGPAIFSIAYLAVPGTVVTFGLYYWALRFAPAYKMSLIAYVIPVVALGLGAAFGDEAVHPRTLAGTALVLLGVGLAARARTQPRSGA
jgi:drug/metabolite transporter (DMT)-like permease